MLGGLAIPQTFESDFTVPSVPGNKEVAKTTAGVDWVGTVENNIIVHEQVRGRRWAALIGHAWTSHLESTVCGLQWVVE